MSELLDFTALLFARPSFAEGVGRVLDLGDTLTEFNSSRTGDLADRIAIASDWNAIGADLRAAVAAAGGAHGETESAG